MIKKKYNTINDFLEDSSFKNWAKQNNGTDINFWEFWIANNPEKEELVYKAKDLVLGISFNKEFVGKEKVAFEWNKLETKIKAKKNTPKRKLRHLKQISAAASVLLLIALSFYFINSNSLITHKTSYGEILNIKLQDGSDVTLNSNSSVSYSKNESRKIWLTGEAFFDVAKDLDKPFIIKSGEVATTVLGTSFNVNTYPENQQVAITVATGKVKVASQESELLLLPNEQGVFDRNSKAISKEKIDIASFLHWKDGIIHFDDAELSKVLQTLERWYGVTFVVDNNTIGNCHITATYDNERLDAILESIVYAKKGLHYQFLDKNKVQLKGKCTD